MEFLSSPDHFSPDESAPDVISWPPTREPSTVGDAKQDQSYYLDNGHEYPVKSLNTFELSVLDQVLGDDENLGKFDIALKI